MDKRKNIADMLKIEQGDISNEERLKKLHIDTIINAANPTLMGSKEGVDGAIHKKIDRKLKLSNSSFNEKICEELDEKKRPENSIRCQRGEAVLTEGYGLCKYVIHVVGSKFDGEKSGNLEKEKRSCSSSRVQLLENCYYEIVEVIKKHADIKNVAIPIIGSGTYGFPFEMAAEIAVSSIGNALIDWKKRDEELFEMASLENIYFFVCNPDVPDALPCMKKIVKEYKKIFDDGNKVVCQTSRQIHFQNLHEIERYDDTRGYFAIAKFIRITLMYIRMFFMPITCLKDRVGKKDWQRRRGIVEWTAILKIIVPFILYAAVKLNCCKLVIDCMVILTIYSLADTVTYLLVLMTMADIQRPSANITRSIILLFGNYIEVSMDIAAVYYWFYRAQNVLFRQAAAFGLMASEIEGMEPEKLIDYAFVSINAGLKFFFVTIVFGYFASHIKQRKFES